MLCQWLGRSPSALYPDLQSDPLCGTPTCWDSFSPFCACLHVGGSYGAGARDLLPPPTAGPTGVWAAGCLNQFYIWTESTWVGDQPMAKLLTAEGGAAGGLGSGRGRTWEGSIAVGVPASTPCSGPASYPHPPFPACPSPPGWFSQQSLLPQTGALQKQWVSLDPARTVSGSSAPSRQGSSSSPALRVCHGHTWLLPACLGTQGTQPQP